jgi:hypothetical protein
MTGVYFASLTGKTVKWDGRGFKVMAGGIMREVA